LPGIVYFHGGGFVLGSLDTHDGLMRLLANASGCRIVAVDYRRAPEAPFPAAHDDACAALERVAARPGDFGIDGNRLAVAGDSAGGNLAAVVAIDLRGDPMRKLKFQLLLYPALWPAEETASRRERDGPVLTKAAMAWFEASLAAQGHPDGRRAAPAQAEDLSGLPPALVVTAGFDPLEHEGRDYAQALMDAGVRGDHLHYSSLVHDFYIMGDVSPAVVLAAQEAAAAIKAAL
jgi:acetyl esterase